MELNLFRGLFLALLMMAVKSAESSNQDLLDTISEHLLQMVGTFQGWGEPKARDRIESLLKGDQSGGTTLKLLDAAGYRYASYYSTSLDGYVTQLVRILPLPKRNEQEQDDSDEQVAQSQRPPEPPVPLVLYGGQSVSLAVFVQEPANRSLALMLAAAGREVWLVPARGVDEANRGLQVGSNLTEDNYWSFSNDEIVDLEFGLQLELVLNVTQAPKLSLIAYSNGAFISLAFLASQPQFGYHNVDTMIALAPAVYVNPNNWFLRFSTLRATNGDDQESLANWWHQQWLWFCRNRFVRFTACKLQLDSLYGPSPIFQTFLSLQLLEQILPPTSADSVRQVMQVADGKRLARIDLGPIANLRNYNQLQAPAYDLSQVRLAGRLYLVTGENDAIAYEPGIEQLKAELDSRLQAKLKHLKLARYNHLDLLAAWDVDGRVVAPIVELLTRRAQELEQTNWRR